MSTSEWVDALRDRRNRLTHVKEAKLSSLDFSNLVNDVEQAFRTFGFSVDSVANIETSVLTTADMEKLQEKLDEERKRYDFYLLKSV